MLRVGRRAGENFFGKRGGKIFSIFDGGGITA
jgi:hypothetical protein